MRKWLLLLFVPFLLGASVQHWHMKIAKTRGCSAPSLGNYTGDGTYNVATSDDVQANKISSFVIDAGSCTRLIVICAIESTIADPSIVSATFGGEDMTLVGSAMADDSPTPGVWNEVFLFYYDTPSGTGDIVTTFDATSAAGSDAICGAIVAHGLAAGGPVSAHGGTSETDASQAIATTITTTANGSYVFSGATFNISGGSYASSQNELWDEDYTSGNGLTMIGSYGVDAVAGSYTVTETATGAVARQVQYIAAWEPG